MIQRFTSKTNNIRIRKLKKGMRGIREGFGFEI